MALEIERKFLVAGNGWRRQAGKGERLVQGYLNAHGRASVRVRIEGDAANLNIKAARVGTSRAEYEYPIELAEAREILDELTLTPPVEKTRYRVEYAGHIWEIDEFAGANAPLVAAEIELEDPRAAFARPDWLGAEITDDVRYYNHALAFHPYNRWSGVVVRPTIDIDLSRQELVLYARDGSLAQRYRVATASRGAGECDGSLRTPRGAHVVCMKIGAGCAAGTVFVGRHPTGEQYSRELGRAAPERDWILARILWLAGTEIGRNQLGSVDTKRRYVYIHGTPDDVPLGEPSSHGCVRMRCADVIELFDRVPAGTQVNIHE